jgi:hypothetical protein
MIVDPLLRRFRQLFSAARQFLDSAIALLGSEMSLRPVPARNYEADGRHVRDFRRGPDHWRGQ